MSEEELLNKQIWITFQVLILLSDDWINIFMARLIS